MLAPSVEGQAEAAVVLMAVVTTGVAVAQSPVEAEPTLADQNIAHIAVLTGIVSQNYVITVIALIIVAIARMSAKNLSVGLVTDGLHL